jgi:hypothetical protein
MMADLVLRFKIGIDTADPADKFYRIRTRWLTCLLFSSVTAVVTGSFGLALSAAALLHIVTSSGRVSVIGLALLVITFPLLVFAAHCIDRVADTNREIRLEAYRKKIFADSKGAGSEEAADE